MNIDGYKPGRIMTFTAPSGGVTSGVPVLIGALLVVPAISAAATEPFEGMTNGVFPGMTKTASQAWTEGAVVYWDNSEKEFTTTKTSNYRVGVAAAAVGNGAGETAGSVRLDGVSTVQEAGA